MKFKKEELIAIFDEEYLDEFEVIEKGDWISSGKMELAHYIFKFEDKFYRVTFSRSGSHYTDWYYAHEDWPALVEVPEVIPVEVVTTVWRAV